MTASFRVEKAQSDWISVGSPPYKITAKSASICIASIFARSKFRDIGLDAFRNVAIKIFFLATKVEFE
jgi:hypothetical protein